MNAQVETVEVKTNGEQVIAIINKMNDDPVAKQLATDIIENQLNGMAFADTVPTLARLVAIGVVNNPDNATVGEAMEYAALICSIIMTEVNCRLEGMIEVAGPSDATETSH